MNMDKFGIHSIRDKIFSTAVQLFSDYGFYNVSIRQISKKVGITVATVYYYFASKDDLLQEMYSFYRENMNNAMPDINRLLKLAETESPFEVLRGVDFHYAPEIQELMDRILIIGAMEARGDRRSAIFIYEAMFELPSKLTTPLLNRMIELGRIEPLDVKKIEILLSNLSFSAALRNHSTAPISMEEWLGMMELVFSLIKPTGK
jgi:AcrR family transcriptional regulator